MEETALLGKLAVLKLNGGLGTTMGIFEWDHILLKYDCSWTTWNVSS
jgi:hypothetical protein